MNPERAPEVQVVLSQTEFVVQVRVVLSSSMLSSASHVP